MLYSKLKLMANVFRCWISGLLSTCSKVHIAKFFLSPSLFNPRFDAYSKLLTFLSQHELLSNFGDIKFEATWVKIYMLGMLEDLQCNASDSREQSCDKASMSG